METELTKLIKQNTHGYNPKIKSSMRTIRWADEVSTPTGIVDSIRFENYYAKRECFCPILVPEKMSTFEKHYLSDKATGICFRDNGTSMSEEKCFKCVWKRVRYVEGIMATCFEVKITLADFSSPNGHNFHGNENYYCVPKELAPKIIDRIPDDVGILAFNGKTLRKYKPSGWREVDDKTMISLLYNAMKKWVDGGTR